MPNTRVIVAVLAVPLVPLLSYYAFISLLAMLAKDELPNIGPFIASILPASYGLTLLIWLPVHLMFRRLGGRSIGTYLFVGAVLWAAVGTIVSGSGASDYWAFILICGLIGVAYAAVFWRIAVGSGSQHAL